MISRADGQTAGAMKEILPVAEIMRRDQALAEAPESIHLIKVAKSEASGSDNW